MIELFCKIFGHRESIFAMFNPEFIGKCGRCGKHYKAHDLREFCKANQLLNDSGE